MAAENETSFMLSPGEDNLVGVKVSPSLMTPYLKGELMASSTRFVYKVPNTILGLIPLGANENTVPIRSIASVNTSTALKIGRLIMGVVLLIAGASAFSSSAGLGIVLILLAAASLAMSFPTQLNVVNHAGGVTSVTVSILDKARLASFAQELQMRVFADLEGTRHDEAMSARMMQTQLQQMLVLHLQNQQMQNQQGYDPNVPPALNAQ